MVVVVVVTTFDIEEDVVLKEAMGKDWIQERGVSRGRKVEALPGRVYCVMS